ncbi:MAG: RNA polymerase sigma factor [Saprospiraceae bacterium]
MNNSLARKSKESKQVSIFRNIQRTKLSLTTNMTERDIIQGCLKKDPKFQRMLVTNYSPTLMTVSRRYCPANIGAEDVLQDAFIKIFGNIHQFNSEKGSLMGWMRKIVINTALKKMKRMSFSHEKATDQFEDIQLHPSIYQHLDAEAIMEIVATLPDGYRQVFNLYAIEGYSHKEIGDLLGIEDATSRSNLSKAKKILRSKINNQKNQESWARIG